MKIAVFGKTPESKKQLERAISSFGFKLVTRNPDIVISYGGDGTLLMSEHKYPGIPKAPFRYSKICNKCHDLPILHALELLENQKYRLEEFIKIETKIGKKKLTAANDIIVRNKEPTSALRFSLEIDGEKKGEYIGDGVVVATPLGSSAYFNSITRKTFKRGIGIAFNNTVRQQKPVYLSENSKIKIKIIRMTAQVAADNNPKILELKEGKSLTIKKSTEKTNLVLF